MTSAFHEYNVRQTIIELVLAESPEAAVGALARILDRQGFNVADDGDRADAFHSETCHCRGGLA